MKKTKSLLFLALLPGAFLMGCNNSNNTPSSPPAPTSTFTKTLTPVPTGTPTNTATQTATGTATGTPTVTPTRTGTSTPTNSATQTATGTPTASATETATSTSTGTPTATPMLLTSNTAATAPSIGTASNYVILTNTSFSNAGASTVCGGLVGDMGAGTGYNTGTAYMLCAGVTTVPDFSGTATTAENSLTTAYNNTVALSGGFPIPADIGGYTMQPGLYIAPSTLAITGVLTMDGMNQANPIFIIQVPAGLTTVAGSPGVPGSTIAFIRGATPANVYWQIGGACTLGTYSIFAGNIMAYAGVVMTSQASLEGRAMAVNAANTFDSNNVFFP